MSSLAPLDLSDLDLPFQLPRQSSASSRAAESRSPGSQPVTCLDRPAPRRPGRPLGPARSFEGVYVPRPKSCTCGCQPSIRQKPLLPPTVAKTPAMARRKRASPADPPPLIAPAVSSYSLALKCISELQADPISDPVRAAAEENRLIGIGRCSRGLSAQSLAVASPRLA